MRKTVLTGVGKTSFGRHVDRTYGSLVEEAVSHDLDDYGATLDERQLVCCSNSAVGLMQGRGRVREQHEVRDADLSGVPLVNVENACPSGSTALNQAWLSVASGQVDVVIAVGPEKLVAPDKQRARAVMRAALDQDRLDEIAADLGAPNGESLFMDLFARFATRNVDRTDATRADSAQVAVKNHAPGALDPKAQYGSELTIEQVLSARAASGPLTVPMSEGAVAAVITTPRTARRWGAEGVDLVATVISTSGPGVCGELAPSIVGQAFGAVGVGSAGVGPADVGPADVGVVECHDAASPAELMVMEELELYAPGDAPELLRAGGTSFGGRIPINPSGGLGGKGHPVEATGFAQVVELTDQLRGRCGERQVGGACIGLAENARGYAGPDAAVASVTIDGSR